MRNKRAFAPVLAFMVFILILGGLFVHVFLNTSLRGQIACIYYKGHKLNSYNECTDITNEQCNIVRGDFNKVPLQIYTIIVPWVPVLSAV